MAEYNGDTSDDYEGPDRRDDPDRNRRSKPDQRKGIRFDMVGGDRRSGFARRKDDEGLRDSDFE